MNSVHILYDGYSYKEGNKMFANCTCTLIKGEKNILIDCMTAWDKDKIIEGLARHGLEPSSIDYAIATHGHSDHLGNLNLFLEATHIVGFTISKNNEFFDHSFDEGEPYVITDDIKVVPTPGHTSDDISIYITIRDNDRNQTKLSVVTGDLFEKEEDVIDSSLWEEQSFDPKTQRKNRWEVAKVADVIIPGHGPKFDVTQEIRDKILKSLQ